MKDLQSGRNRNETEKGIFKITICRISLPIRSPSENPGKDIYYTSKEGKEREFPKRDWEMIKVFGKPMKGFVNFDYGLVLKRLHLRFRAARDWENRGVRGGWRTFLKLILLPA